MGDAMSDLLDERDKFEEYIRKNLKTLLPYLINMESVRQLILWHKNHFKKKEEEETSD